MLFASWRRPWERGSCGPLQRLPPSPAGRPERAARWALRPSAQRDYRYSSTQKISFRVRLLVAALVALAAAGVLVSSLPDLYAPFDSESARDERVVLLAWSAILAAWLWLTVRARHSPERLWQLPMNLFRTSVVLGPVVLVLAHVTGVALAPPRGGREIGGLIEGLSYECGIVLLASLAAFATSRSLLRQARALTPPPPNVRDLSVRSGYLVSVAGASFATGGVLLAVLLDFPNTPSAVLVGNFTIALCLVAFSAFIGLLVGDDAARNVEALTRRVRELAAHAPRASGEVPVLSADELGALAQAVQDLERRVRRDEAEASAIAERERIARELHDGAAKAVSALALEAASLRGRGDESLARDLSRMEKVARDLSDELRAIVRDLRARSDPLPFSMVIASSVSSHPIARLEFGMGVEAASPLVRYQITRIIGEALRNADAHAQATSARVRLETRDERLQLIVEDDGVGVERIDWDRLVRDGHFGLVGMRERARLLGGDLSIGRANGHGTRIVVDVPMRSEE